MRSRVVIEIMERRILLAAAAPTQLAAFAAFGVAQGGIVVDSQGDIFGVTQATSNVFGSIYELPAGATQIQTIRSSIEAQGAGPASNLLIDSDGDVFGDMPTGGLSGHGVVFEIPKSLTGEHNVIALVSYGGNDGSQLGNGLVSDVAGDLFVLAEPGSSTSTIGTTTTTGNGAILELPVNGSSLQTLATFPASVNPVGRLAIDSAGDLFAATETGGTYNAGAIYELPAGSSNMKLIASFTTATPTPQGDLIADAHGDVFGTTDNGATTGSTISTVFTVTAGKSFPEILMSDTNFDGSHIQGGLVRDSAGNLYGAIDNTQSPSTVFKISHNKFSFGGSTTIARIPEIASSTANANQANGYLALDSAGNLFGTTILTTQPRGNQSDTIFKIPSAGAPATASQIQIITQPTATVIDTEMTPAPTVELLDSNNNLVTSANSSISVQLKSGPAGAILGGTLSVQAFGGIVTFTDLFINQLGTYKLRFTGSSLTSATSKSFKINPSPLDGSHLVITPISSGVVAGAKIPPITVTAETSSNAVSVGTKGKVTLSIATTSVSLKNTTLATKTVSMKNGVAVFSNIIIKQAGTYSVTASNAASAPPVGSESLTIIPAAAKKLVFSRQPPNSVAGAVFAVELQLLDKFGNVAEDNSSISLSLLGGPPGASLTGTLTRNAANGLADFSDLSILTPGSYKISGVDQTDGLKATSASFKISSVKS